MTTLGTTRTDHSTTTAGTHAHEEAVGAFTAHDRWLIGAFHGKTPYSRKAADYSLLPSFCQALQLFGPVDNFS